MTVWLIGNRGMLGADVESLLVQEGLSYLATDQEVDITHKEALKSYIDTNADMNIAWIVNCSGYTAVDQAEDEPEIAFRVNTDGVGNIAEIAHLIGATLIHISTDYVYSGGKETEYYEDDPPAPLGVYGESKWGGEQLIYETIDRYYTLRTAWLYGGQGQNFVRTMLRTFQKRDEVRVVADQWGSPTFTKDLAGAILKIIHVNGENFGIYHFTNEEKTNWFTFSREIYKQAYEQGLLDREIKLVPVASEDYPTKAHRPKNSYLSKEKIKKTFGISIRTWQEALHDFLVDNGSKICAS